MVNTPPRSPISSMDRTWIGEPGEIPSGAGGIHRTPPGFLSLGGVRNLTHRGGTSTADQTPRDSGMEGRIMDNVARMMNASVERQAEMMNSSMERQTKMFIKLLNERNAEPRRPEINTGVINQTGNPGPETEKRTDRNCSYKTFLSCKPPEFKGEYNPIACMNWLREIEQAFRACECNENSKVRYASQMLRGNALNWWNVLTASLASPVLEALPWGSFKEKILKEYCNEHEMDRIEEEFRNLKKGNMSVRRYTELFMERLNLVGHVAPAEKHKVKAYLKGLPTDMMSRVRNSKAVTLIETIEEAKMIEEMYTRDKEEKTHVGEKRKWEGHSDSSQKLRLFGKNMRPDSRKEPSWCSKCKSKHFGQCRVGGPECYKCGKTGHIAINCSIPGVMCFECKQPGHIRKDCPKLKKEGDQGKKLVIPKPTGRAFQMTAEEAKGSKMWSRICRDSGETVNDEIGLNVGLLSDFVGYRNWTKDLNHLL